MNDSYDNWTLLDPTAKGKMLICRCACGTEKPVNRYNLIRWKTSSCGCVPQPGPVKHGLHGSEEYKTWKSMKARCYNPKHKNFADYGGRGIKVSDEWKNDFAAFRKDMGERPSRKHSIERNDTNGDYCAGNCRWATQTEQTRNTRRSKTITVDGVTRTVAEWSELTGIPSNRIYHRLYAGRTGANALYGARYSRAHSAGIALTN